MHKDPTQAVARMGSLAGSISVPDDAWWPQPLRRLPRRISAA